MGYCRPWQVASESSLQISGKKRVSQWEQFRKFRSIAGNFAEMGPVQRVEFVEHGFANGRMGLHRQHTERLRLSISQKTSEGWGAFLDLAAGRKYWR